MENTYCVYCHVSPDGKRYIGVTKRKPEKRWNYGKGYINNSYFTRAIEKYGWNAFKHIVLCEKLTRAGASNLEKRFIEYYETTNRSKGYNLDCGGLYGDKELSDETKRKIGDAHRGRYTEAQWAATIARRGKGHPHTEEAKKKIGDAHRGRHLSEEQRKHLSEINQGKKMPESVKEKLRVKNGKRINQYTMDGIFIRSYKSIKETAKAMGVKPPSISACCRGIVSNSCGFLWRYADNDNGENETGGSV